MHKRTIITTFFSAVTAGALILTTFGSCQKDRVIEYVSPDSTFTGRIKFVLQYNPSEFSIFYSYLQQAGLADTLSTPGPFTAFVTLNSWFQGDYTAYIKDVSQYILPSAPPLKQIEPDKPKLFFTPRGYKIWLNAYDDGNTRRYFANGMQLQTVDQPATNGLIQLLMKGMPDTYAPSCLQYINASSGTTLFAYALRRTHLDDLLKDSSSAYSVLLPNNNAFANVGIDFDSLSREDPDTLSRLVKAHILKGRFFSYDYLSRYQGDGSAQDTVSLPTIGADSVRMIITPDGSTEPLHYFLQFAGALGNTAGMGIGYWDYPAGAGVVRNIDVVLKP